MHLRWSNLGCGWSSEEVYIAVTILLSLILFCGSAQIGTSVPTVWFNVAVATKVYCKPRGFVALGCISNLMLCSSNVRKRWRTVLATLPPQTHTYITSSNQSTFGQSAYSHAYRVLVTISSRQVGTLRFLLYTILPVCWERLNGDGKRENSQSP
jgi:hypothetical protein